MTRVLPTYSADRLREATRKAERETGWREADLIATMAAHDLAGHQADDASIDHAKGQVIDYLAQSKVEGR